MNKKHIHILGICGTFMGSLAIIARQKGFKVTGCDQDAYPPMSNLLKKNNIEVIKGWSKKQVSLKPDIFIIGNSLKRENELVKSILEKKLNFISGPQWLYENILKDKVVISISGTHGKTTTTSMVVHILSAIDKTPGYLIAGSTKGRANVNIGKSKYFVIESDEYDSAFFDKRPKFVHYFPEFLVINNIEFDHADIFLNLQEIKKQFEFLTRTLRGRAVVIGNYADKNIRSVLGQEKWFKVKWINKKNNWTYKLKKNNLKISYGEKEISSINFPMIGKFNAENALNSIALVSSLGFNPKKASLALENYCGVERRQEIIYSSDDFILIDDFGHHPTAIRKTVDAIKYQYKKYKIIVIADLKSNSMKMGAHNENLLDSFKNTDKTYLNTASINWKIKDVFNNKDEKFNFFRQDQKLIMALKQTNLSKKTIFLFFSNANNYELKHSIISLLKEYEK